MPEDILKTKISALPAANALSDADVFPVVQAGVSKKATKSQIAASLSENGVRFAEELTLAASGTTVEVTVNGGTFPVDTFRDFTVIRYPGGQRLREGADNDYQLSAPNVILNASAVVPYETVLRIEFIA